MSQPMEVTIYARAGGAYAVPLRVWSPASAAHLQDDFVVSLSENDVQQRIESKRLTDAELSAEFWHAAQVATYARGRIDWGLPVYGAIDADRAEDIEHILQRFAELPHHDEAKQ